ncbi:MAG: DUF547 domain-containing protein [Comamonadaceae bacterium]|nr:DUF547 domain-containing protein [Comamonadaceae bacterium]
MPAEARAGDAMNRPAAVALDAAAARQRSGRLRPRARGVDRAAEEARGRDRRRQGIRRCATPASPATAPRSRPTSTALSAVDRAGVRTAGARPQQLAFLINAYNAFTVEQDPHALPEPQVDPGLRQLRRQPVEGQASSRLLGQADAPRRHRARHHPRAGRFDEPRIHFAVNCASIGCPMLREEAYVAPRLDAQLEEQTLRFLSDRSRNRYDPASGRLEVSSIFDWYGKDFSPRLEGLPLASSSSSPGTRTGWRTIRRSSKTIREQKAGLKFLDYDWALNDAKP